MLIEPQAEEYGWVCSVFPGRAAEKKKHNGEAELFICLTCIHWCWDKYFIGTDFQNGNHVAMYNDENYDLIPYRFCNFVHLQRNEEMKGL